MLTLNCRDDRAGYCLQAGENAPTPSRLAHEAATLFARCESDEEIRDTALHTLRLAAERGLNHGDPAFVQALCDDLKELADDEAHPSGSSIS